jgi:hypothetical protein
LNVEFKAIRKAATVIRYHDFLNAKKLAMLERSLNGADAAQPATSRLSGP